MKQFGKLLLLMIFVVSSCKKENEQKRLSVNDISGYGWIKGILHRTVIAPNGANPAGWNNETRIPAANIPIRVRVQTNGTDGIYPNSNFQSTEVFTGSTDVNGNFVVAVRSNGTSNGVNATVIIEGFQSTQDTLINGIKKIGRSCNYFGMSNNITVYKGQSSWWNDIPVWSFSNNNMTVVNDLSNPTSAFIGNAVITGSVIYSIYTQSITVQTQTTGPGNSTTMISPTTRTVMNGTKVYCTFNSDPLTLSTRVYQTATSGGNYTFNISTVDAGTPGFGQNGVIWASDYAAAKDTFQIKTTYNGTFAGTSQLTLIAGKSGIYDAPAGISQSALYSNEIRNAVNILYTGFTAN